MEEATQDDKPLDKDVIKYISNLDVPIIIYEESSLLGGFGSAVIEHLVINKIDTSKVTLMGIKDEYIEQGSKDLGEYYPTFFKGTKYTEI